MRRFLKWFAMLVMLAVLAGLVLVRLRVLAPETSLGEVVNGAIDDILATGTRLLELPLFMVLAAIGTVGAVLAAVAVAASRKRGRGGAAALCWAFMAVLVVCACAYVVDRKIVRIQDEVRELRTRAGRDSMALLDTLARQTRPAAQRTSCLFDVKEAQDVLAKSFGKVRTRPLVYDEATDTVQIHIVDPLAQAYLAVVDLRHPAVEIVLSGTITRKALTSEFARDNDCTVAVNGEAGRSPELDSGFGEWKGHFVCRGQVLLQEDPKNPRPFLSFDRKNRPAYCSAGAAGRAITPEMYNVIWGRSDALIAGQAQTADSRNRQPRTAMGISKDGSRLYLLVVDGRQPNYSMGLTRADVGRLLKAFGAHDAMLCDEGGSSCMYLKRLGGITNIPSDGVGQERPTYTHFGIAFREGG